MARVFSSICAAYVIVVLPHHITSRHDSVTSLNHAVFVKGAPPVIYVDRNNSTLANVDVDSPMHCALKCLQTDGCRSFLYKETDVPHENCFSEETAQQYSGTRHVVYSGETCRHWDTRHYWRSYFSGAEFPEGSLSAAENYCRDPTREGFLWCPMNEDFDSWGSCNMPRCMQTNCRLFEFESRFSSELDHRVKLEEDIVFYG